MHQWPWLECVAHCPGCCARQRGDWRAFYVTGLRFAASFDAILVEIEVGGGPVRLEEFDDDGG